METPETISTVGSAEPIIVGSGVEALNGMAVFGQTAVALIIVVGLIFGLSLLLRRLNQGQRSAGSLLRTIASVAVGTKERVVIVEIKETWLVLGVSGSQITKLHELPAQRETQAAKTDEQGKKINFAARLQALLEQSGGNTRDPEKE